MPRRKSPPKESIVPGKTRKSAPSPVTNSTRVAEVLRLQEQQFEQRINNVVAQLYQERAASEQLIQQFKQRQQAFEQARRDREQLQRDAAGLRALLQASRDALLGTRPLSPEMQRKIDAALRPGGPAPADGKLAA